MHLLNVAAKYSMCIGYSLYTHPFCMLSPIPCIMFHVFGGLHVEKKRNLGVSPPSVKRLVVIRRCLIPSSVVSTVYADGDLDSDVVDSSTRDNNLTVCIAAAIFYTSTKRPLTRSLTHREAQVMGESHPAPRCPYEMHGPSQM